MAGCELRGLVGHRPGSPRRRVSARTFCSSGTVVPPDVTTTSRAEDGRSSRKRAAPRQSALAASGASGGMAPKAGSRNAAAIAAGGGRGRNGRAGAGAGNDREGRNLFYGPGIQDARGSCTARLRGEISSRRALRTARRSAGQSRRIFSIPPNPTGRRRRVAGPPAGVRERSVAARRAGRGVGQ